MNMPNNTSSSTGLPSINYSPIPLFPSIVLQTTVPTSLTKELAERAYELRAEGEGIDASNMGGWHSPLQPLPEQLHRYVPFPETEGATSWYMINQNMQGNYSHDHPQNDWAGVIWLKVPKKHDAKLEFEHPDCFAQYNAINSIGEHHPEIRERFNYWQAYAFPPKEGVLLLFPASLRHRVYFNQSDEDRVSLSFNLALPKRER
tara:strand:- start:720 stop:1328 length:609 start_codon:yes stop_codon:yes gene_type:complete